MPPSPRRSCRGRVRRRTTLEPATPNPAPSAANVTAATRIRRPRSGMDFPLVSGPTRRGPRSDRSDGPTTGRRAVPTRLHQQFACATARCVDVVIAAGHLLSPVDGVCCGLGGDRDVETSGEDGCRRVRPATTASRRSPFPNRPGRGARARRGGGRLRQRPEVLPRRPSSGATTLAPATSSPASSRGTSSSARSSSSTTKPPTAVGRRRRRPCRRRADRAVR